jgi:hypothetical protein
VYFLDAYDEMFGDNRCTKIKFKDVKGEIFSAVETFSLLRMSGKVKKLF